MQTNTFQSDRRYRLAFGLTFVTGFALCTRGIAHTTEYGWLHPSSVSGITLGVAAMSLAGAVLIAAQARPDREREICTYHPRRNYRCQIHLVSSLPGSAINFQK